MKISKNTFALNVYSGVRKSSDALYNSMRRLSTGERLTRPGDAPADYGISENFRFQIRNSVKAKANIENARNLMGTADGWMQSVNDILSRMSELATSAKDGSKSNADRENLNVEFMQLKEEVSRIAKEAKFNGVQIAGSDQMLTYDLDKETFFFSQLDGGESYALPNKVLSGVQSENSQNFLFDSSKDYTLSDNGQYIYYVDSNDNLTKFDIENNILYRDTADLNEKGVEVDETGRLWYATETAAGSGVYSLRQQDVSSWTQDTTLIGNGDITDMGSTEFQVYQDRVYYVDTSGDLVSRDLNSSGNLTTELSNSDLPFATTAGQFAISQEGMFMADVPSAGVIRVTNIATKESTSFNVGAGVSVDDLAFGSDNLEIMYRDTTDNAIYRMEMKGESSPVLFESRRVHTPSGALGFAGLSLDGGSHRTNFKVHNGPDAGQMSVLTAGDVRLHTLGLSRANVLTIEDADLALDSLSIAIDRVSVQRAKIGAEMSRLDYMYDSMVQYHDDISVADSALRDLDVIRESSEMLNHQVRYQGAIAILAQANQTPQSVLSLLRQGG